MSFFLCCVTGSQDLQMGSSEQQPSQTSATAAVGRRSEHPGQPSAIVTAAREEAGGAPAGGDGGQGSTCKAPDDPGVQSSSPRAAPASSGTNLTDRLHARIGSAPHSQNLQKIVLHQDPHPGPSGGLKTSASSTFDVLSLSSELSELLKPEDLKGLCSSRRFLEVCTSPHHMVRDIDSLSYISRGASSVVFHGIWQSAEVAIKFLVSHFSANSASVREALLGTELAHPNLVQCYGARCVTLDERFIRQAIREAAASAQEGSQKPGSNNPWRSSFDSEDGFGPPPSANLGVTAGMTGSPRVHVANSIAAAQAAALAAAVSTGGLATPSRSTVSRPQPLGSSTGADVTQTQTGTSQPRNTSADGTRTSPDTQGGLATPGGAASSTSRLASLPSNASSVMGGTALSVSVAHALATTGSQRGTPPPHLHSPWGEGTSWGLVLQALNATPGQVLTCIIAEYCDLGTLSGAIHSKQLFIPKPGGDPSRLALRALLRTAREVAMGLNHLHEAGVVHGDLKPANVVLSGSRLDRRGFVAKLTDLGLSRVLGNAAPDAEEDPGVSDADWGTTAYMSPEHFEGKLVKAGDLYSLGVMLWEMAHGRKPFAGLHHSEIVSGVKKGSLRLVWEAPVPEALKLLGEWCVSWDYRVRPTCLEVIHHLAAIEGRVREEIRAERLGAPSAGHLSSTGGSTSYVSPSGSAGAGAGRDSGAVPSAVVAHTLRELHKQQQQQGGAVIVGAGAAGSVPHVPQGANVLPGGGTSSPAATVAARGQVGPSAGQVPGVTGATAAAAGMAISVPSSSAQHALHPDPGAVAAQQQQQRAAHSLPAGALQGSVPPASPGTSQRTAAAAGQTAGRGLRPVSMPPSPWTAPGVVVPATLSPVGQTQNQMRVLRPASQPAPQQQPMPGALEAQRAMHAISAQTVVHQEGSSVQRDSSSIGGVSAVNVPPMPAPPQHQQSMRMSRLANQVGSASASVSHLQAPHAGGALPPAAMPRMGFNTGLPRQLSSNSSGAGMSAVRSSSMPSAISSSAGGRGDLPSNAVIRPLPRASQLQQLNEASIAAAAAAAAAGGSRSGGGAATSLSGAAGAGSRVAVKVPGGIVMGPKSPSSADQKEQLRELRAEGQSGPRTSSAPEAPVRVSPDGVSRSSTGIPQQLPLPVAAAGGQRPSAGAHTPGAGGEGRALAWAQQSVRMQAAGVHGQQQEAEESDPALQRPRSD